MTWYTILKYIQVPTVYQIFVMSELCVYHLGPGKNEMVAHGPGFSACPGSLPDWFPSWLVWVASSMETPAALVITVVMTTVPSNKLCELSVTFKHYLSWFFFFLRACNLRFDVKYWLANYIMSLLNYCILTSVINFLIRVARASCRCRGS